VVRKWNRSDVPEKNTSALEEACKGASIVFTMLADDAAVLAVTSEIFKFMAKGAIHCSLSTISAKLAKRLEAGLLLLMFVFYAFFGKQTNPEHSDHGQEFVCCPVFGRPDAAAKGLLFCLPGSSKQENIVALRSVVSAFSVKQFDFQSPKQSAIAKVCGNFLILSTIESLGEVFCVAEKAGISNRALLDMFLGTIFASPVFTRYGNILVNREFEPAGFAMHLGLKDIRLFLEAGEELRCPAPFAGVVRDRFLQTLANPKYEKLDWSAILLSIRASAGLQ
jgi:3-hydroxyisobutyrate dehydrogenase-like beta-hydroxyacid dehydrogenase